MGNVSYIAKVNLTSGVNVGDLEGIINDFEIGVPEDVESKIQVETLSRKVHTIFEGQSREWNITTAPVKGQTNIDKWLEFFGSTRAGEVFTIDIYGDGNTLQVVRMGSYGHIRVGSYKWYAFTFKVREV